MSLIIRTVSYIHPDNEVLFRDLNFSIKSRAKAALVGINGAGKSTLLQILVRRILQSSGEIISAERTWFVPQHLGEFDNLTIAQALDVEIKLHAIAAILEGDGSPQHFTDLDDDWEIEEKVKRSLEKWGLADVDLEDHLGRLSGGEKTKVFLAGLDIHSPEVILFDEPTNHLDSKTRKKLYEYILQSKASSLVVSHDKTLLNLMNKTLELSNQALKHLVGILIFSSSKNWKRLEHLMRNSMNSRKR